VCAALWNTQSTVGSAEREKLNEQVQIKKKNVKSSFHVQHYFIYRFFYVLSLFHHHHHHRHCALWNFCELRDENSTFKVQTTDDVC
jgi:hypothetical protein